MPFGSEDGQRSKSQSTDELAQNATENNAVLDDILSPVLEHTGLVKVQGPFNDRQLKSIAEGLVYLRKLGLIPIIVVDFEGWSARQRDARIEINDEVMRLVEMLEKAGGSAWPITQPVLKRSKRNGFSLVSDSLFILEAAIRQGEIPVLPPVALDSACHVTCVTSNELMLGLAKGLQYQSVAQGSTLDLTPLRLMVINREGGIPSHARGGTPHLSINLESEYDYIVDTFDWHKTHPTSLNNLSTIRDCLEVLPRTSSAVIVSHRSPKALIANLVTNRPAHSPSLHVSALPSIQKLEQTPTVLRYGLPIRVHRSLEAVDLDLLTILLERSFGRILDKEAYFQRLETSLDFMIIAGDSKSYAAVAIVTKEGEHQDISYLDKFAALPSVQGDGTIDFLWGALRDESFGLGLLDALNNNGGLEGKGNGVDLVWRSRADNPINKWYFERSNGFAKLKEMGKGGTPGALFWCDAEQRLEQDSRDADEVPFITELERGRLGRWAEAIGSIPSCWKR